jgi:glycosyltransferase involved in cell wall biosynthesis
MRILMVSEDIPMPGIGGLAGHTLALARALAAAGHTVDLMGNDDYPASENNELLQFGGHFFPDLHGQFTGWKEMQIGIFFPWKRIVVAKRFAAAILQRAHDYDVIHYHGHLPNIASHLPSYINFIQTRHDQGSDCLIHTRFARGQICTSVNPGDCAQCRSKHPNFLQRSVSAYAVNQYRRDVINGYKRHKTVFVSQQLLKNCQRGLGPSVRGTVLHNFIDEQRIQTALSSATTSSATDRIRVLIAAKLYAAKGVGTFLKTLATHPHESLEISVVGNGPEEAELRNAFHSVHFYGWQNSSQTLQLTAHADAVIVPSICEESCATTVLEGLALGKTVFALRLGGTPELSIYASTPTQLQLFDDMPSLVKGLLAFASKPSTSTPSTKIATAKQAARALLKLYALPPGPITTAH